MNATLWQYFESDEKCNITRKKVMLIKLHLVDDVQVKQLQKIRQHITDQRSENLPTTLSVNFE